MTNSTIEQIKMSRSNTLYGTLIISFSLIAILSCLSVGLLTYFLRASGIRDEQARILETLRDEKMGDISS